MGRATGSDLYSGTTVIMTVESIIHVLWPGFSVWQSWAYTQEIGGASDFLSCLGEIMFHGQYGSLTGNSNQAKQPTGLPGWIE